MIVLPIITLIAIFIYYWILNDAHFGVVNMLILTYIIMCSASLVLEQFPILHEETPILFEPMAYLSVCFIIMFLGFTKFRDQRLTSIRIERIFLFKLMEFFLIIGGFGSALFFSPFAVAGLKGEISLNRIEMVAYGSKLADYGIINSICSLFANLFIISQVCSFINLIPLNGRRNVYKSFLMLISSMSFIIYVLAYAGRDGVVYWLMSYAFCFFLFRDFLSIYDLKKIKIIFICIFLTLMIPFYMITASRFSEMTGGTLIWSIHYAGQQLRNFSDHYQISLPLLYGKHTLPIIYDFLNLLGFNITSKYDIDIFHSYFLIEGVLPWVFTTFIGNFIYDFGKTCTLLILCIMSLTVRKLLKKMRKTGILEFSNLLLFILIYQTVYWGVFYFRLYIANYYVLFIILLCLAFKVVRSSRYSIIFSKTKSEPGFKN